MGLSCEEALLGRAGKSMGVVDRDWRSNEG